MFFVLPVIAPAPASASPIQIGPALSNLPTSELLLKHDLTLFTGYTTPPGAALENGSGGSGNQTYLGGIGWGATDALTLLFGISVNDDPSYAPIRGEYRDQYHVALAFGGRGRLLTRGRLEVAAQGDWEGIWVSSAPGLFNEGPVRDKRFVNAFALDLPITVRPSSRVTASLIPSLARLPDRVMGAPYYGTVYRLGARIDTRIGDAWTLWGAAEMPFGPGNSTLDRRGRLRRLATWRTGARYHATARATLDVTITNAAGGTAATRHLTQLGAPVTLYSLALRYAPTVTEAPDPAAAETASPLGALGGVTIPGANTLPAIRGRASSTVDFKGGVGVQVAWALGRRFQFELMTARMRGPDAPAVLEAPIGDGFQYRFGPQIQVLDESEGSVISLAGRVTVGRDVDDQQGYLLAEVIAARSITPNVLVVFDPLVMESGGRSLGSLGVGAWLAVGRVTLMPEARISISGERPVWTTGARLPTLGRFVLDLFVTNAGSTLGLGRMLADPDGFRAGGTIHVAL